jgi:hypothetical protein
MSSSTTSDTAPRRSAERSFPDAEQLRAELRGDLKAAMPGVELVVNEAIAEGHSVPKKLLVGLRKLGLNVPESS